MFDRNRRILKDRWPRVLRALEAAPAPGSVELIDDSPSPTLEVDGIRLASAHDPFSEALLQSTLVPVEAERATVYGVALGELQRVLLGRESLRKLDVVVLAPGASRASFAHFDHTDWLADERVELLVAEECEEVKAPFAACPAALRLADDGGSRIRDCVVLELATPFIRRHVKEREGELAARLAANRAVLEREGDVAELFGSRGGATAFVAGAGPTLAECYERLRGRSGAEPLVAVDAALRPLLEAGVVPDVVVAMEANTVGLRRFFEGDLGACGSVPLVFGAVVGTEVLELWPGPKLAAYTTESRYTSLIREVPRGVLFTSGSVLHPAVDLAVRMGAERVVLCGADFSFPQGMSHVEGSRYAHAVEGWEHRGVWVRNGRGERVPTLPNLRGYLRDLERYVGRVGQGGAVEFRTASLNGAEIVGAPPLEELTGG